MAEMRSTVLDDLPSAGYCVRIVLGVVCVGIHRLLLPSSSGDIVDEMGTCSWQKDNGLLVSLNKLGYDIS